MSIKDEYQILLVAESKTDNKRVLIKTDGSIFVIDADKQFSFEKDLCSHCIFGNKEEKCISTDKEKYGCNYENNYLCYNGGNTNGLR